MNKTNISVFRGYLIPILVIVVVVLLVPFVLFPQLDRIKQKNIEVKESQERLSKLNKKLSDLRLIDENSESQKLLEIEKAVPSDKKVAQLIVGVRNIAAESKLAVTDMNFKPGLVSTGSATISASKKSSRTASAKGQVQGDRFIFNVTLRGLLADVKNFLVRMEKAKRLLGVETIKAEQDKDEANKYSFEFSIHAPITKLSSKGDIVSEPLPIITQQNEDVFEFVSNLKDYTSVNIQTVPTGASDPFK